MNLVKPLAHAVIALSLAIGGASAAFAKAHDKGAADGEPSDDPSALRGGGVADVVSRARTGQIFGLDVVVDQAQDDPNMRRIDPKARSCGFPPGQQKDCSP